MVRKHAISTIYSQRISFSGRLTTHGHSCGGECICPLQSTWATAKSCQVGVPVGDDDVLRPDIYSVIFWLIQQFDWFGCKAPIPPTYTRAQPPNRDSWSPSYLWNCLARWDKLPHWSSTPKKLSSNQTGFEYFGTSKRPGSWLNPRGVSQAPPQGPQLPPTRGVDPGPPKIF